MVLSISRIFTIRLLVVVVSLTTGAYGHADAFAYESHTFSDREISIEDLGLRLKPLTRSDLAIEAEGWFRLLQENITACVEIELQTHDQNREIDSKEQSLAGLKNSASETVVDAKIEIIVDAKEQLLLKLTALRIETGNIADRFILLLDHLDEKGGDTEVYRQYVEASTTIDVNLQDIKDVSAFRIMAWGWLKSPEGGLYWVKKLTLFLFVLFIFYGLSSLLGNMTTRFVAKSKNCSELLGQFFIKTVRKTILVFGVLFALTILGINIGPVLAGIGAIGFVVGFALQGTLSNFASGLMILMYRPFDVGDLIETAEAIGEVDSMSLVSTTIKTLDNRVVIVPNNTIWGGIITNITASKTRRIDMIFGISYGDDIGKAEAILKQIADDHAMILADPQPIIEVHELGDSSVNFAYRPWVETVNYWTVYWDVMRTVKEKFDAANISIPFPQRDVHLYHANADKLPEGK